MQAPKLLLCSVFGPYGVKDEYAEGFGCQMELLNNQITREQGVHSPRQSYWSFGLYLMAENLGVDTTILDFPSWRRFKEELKKGYTHIGISFIMPNVFKARRMARYIRERHPEMKIILGGYGTVLPDLQEMVPHDAACRGEGVRWLREYFGENPETPVRHPALIGPAYDYIYGYSRQPAGGILMTGLGCENACAFCITSHQFGKRYVHLLKTGREVFEACERTEREARACGFSIMDENFLKQPQRARELLAEMEARNRPYVFDIFSSAETIQKVGVDFLVRLGIRMVWIGVESKFSTHPKTKDIDLRALIAELRSKGIVVQASMILFQDHHDERTIREDIDWVVGLDSDLVQFMNYIAIPSTTLHDTLTAQGRIKDLSPRFQHGAGELNFDHPHFKNPADHIRILRDAFRAKYRAGGPGVVNMALTAVRGYLRLSEEHKARQQRGEVWNPATLRYAPAADGQAAPDTFMRARLRMMKQMVRIYRPSLLAGWVYAPNRAARKKAREAMALYTKAFGKPRMADRVAALVLVVTGGIEFARIALSKLLGREGIVRQPPCRRTEYHNSLIAADPAQADARPFKKPRIAGTPEG